MFFRPVFLKKNEKMIGKVEEIFGPINEHVTCLYSSDVLSKAERRDSGYFFKKRIHCEFFSRQIVMNQSHLMYLDRFTQPKRKAERGLKPMNQQGMTDRRVSTGQFGFKGRGAPQRGGQRGFRGGGGGGFRGQRGGGRGRGGFTSRGNFQRGR